MPRSLTKKQRLLVKEIRAISETLKLDMESIYQLESVHRTTKLEVLKRQIVRGEVVTQFTLIDEWLATRLCEYFFPKGDWIRLWKSKKFERFNYYVLEHLYTMHKLAFLKDVYHVPKDIAGSIEAINALRNAMAHAFFPENLRAYRMKRRHAQQSTTLARYKGEDIFTLAGVEKFKSDCADVTCFLRSKIKRRRKPSPIPSAGGGTNGDGQTNA